MLILTRRTGEAFMIGNDVTITVLGVKGNQVRIGIDAPKNVGVHREEIFKRIKQELAHCTDREHFESGAGCSDAACPVHGEHRGNTR